MNHRDRTNFWAGVLAMASVQSLVQDAGGQEATVELAKLCWVSAWVTVPMALLGLLLVGAAFFLNLIEWWGE